MNTLSTATAAGRAATPALARGLNPAQGPAGFRQALQSATQAADDTAASDGAAARRADTDEEAPTGPLALAPAETPADGGADTTPNALDLSSLLAQMGHQGVTPTPTAGSATTSASQDDAGMDASLDGGGSADARRVAAGARRHLPARGTSPAPSGTAQPAASAAPLGSAAPSDSAAPLVAGTAGAALPEGRMGLEALNAPAPTAAAVAAKAAGAWDGRAQAASGQAQPPDAALSGVPAPGQAAVSPLAAARPAPGRQTVDGVSGRAGSAERGSRAAAGTEARTAGAQAHDSRLEIVAGGNGLPGTATPGMPGTAGQPTQASGPDPTAAPQDSTLASTLMASAATVPVPTQPGADPAAPPPGTATSPFHAYVAAAVQSRGFAPALGAQMRMLVSEGVSEAQLELNPTDMGPVSVRIALEGTQARVEFGADLADTRAALQDSMPSLAAALRESGFTLTGGGVSERQAGGSGAGGEEPGGRRSPNAPAGVGTGRGDVAAAPAGPAAPAAGRGRSTVDLYA